MIKRKVYCDDALMIYEAPDSILVLSLHSGLDEFFLSDDKIVIVHKICDDSLIILNYLWDQI